MNDNMAWQKDLIKDIRQFTHFDDQDGGIPHPTYTGDRGEFTPENSEMLLERFLRVKDKCRAILEIGVHREGPNNTVPSTHTFLNNKNPDTIYVGIDLDDKTFLNNKENNIYTIKDDSSNFEKIWN